MEKRKIKPNPHNLKALEAGAIRMGWTEPKAVKLDDSVILFAQQRGSMRIDKVGTFQCL